ncbi:MAG: DUF4097 family beta strand repeat-containing protein [Eubacteriales bacterium]
MKVTSVIFLILSLVLIVSGFFVCSYARDHAPNDAAIDGPSIEDGQILTEIEYSDQNVSRISLNLEDCTVTIHGGAKSSYVKLTNFEPNKYIGSVSNKTLTISNIISIGDYLNLDGSGVSFAGVWRTLRSFVLAKDDTEKSVDIYISDDEDIKQMTLNLVNCDIQVLDVGQKCDITLTGTDSTVELNTLDFSTMTFECTNTDLSMLSVSAETFDLTMTEGNLTMRSVAMEEMEFDTTGAKLNLIDSVFTDCTISLDESELQLKAVNAKSNYNRDILLEDGELIIDGENLGISDSYEDENLFASIKISAENSNVTLEFGDVLLDPPVTSEPTTPETTTDES